MADAPVEVACPELACPELVEVIATAIAYCIFDSCALLQAELTYNRGVKSYAHRVKDFVSRGFAAAGCASTQGHNKGPCGRGWGTQGHNKANDCHAISW
jgi:hypothetical protein